MNYNEKVISILNSRELTEEQKAKLEEIFPDLRDSKDERIRKVLLSHFSRYQKEEVFLNNITMGDIAAYLEKQGEHANFRNKIQIGDKVTRNEDGVLVNLSQLKRVAKNDEKQGEQDRIHKHKIGDTVYYNSFGEVKSMIVANMVTDSTDNPMYEDENGNAVFEKDLIEQKHAETEKGAKGNDREIQNSAWSKDDEYYYGIIQYCLNNKIVGKADKENAISWFQSLKDRVQPQQNQEWSEEDENIKESIIIGLEMLKDGASDKSLIALYNKKIDWLKFLKERCTWKPCDLPHWQKSNLPNHTATGFNSDYFCHKGYCINYKELFEKLPKDD